MRMQTVERLHLIHATEPNELEVIPSDWKVIQVLMKMQKPFGEPMKSGAPVVSRIGKLVGNFSASNLKVRRSLDKNSREGITTRQLCVIVTSCVGLSFASERDWRISFDR